MDIIRKDQINALLTEQEWPALSMYLPISRSGDEGDPLRYKELLARAEAQLREGGLNAVAVRRLLEEEEAVAGDREFWLNSGADGLAVFRSEQEAGRFFLPFPCREMTLVGKRFHIKPLVPLLNDTGFYLLSLSKGGVRLFRGDRFVLEEMPLPENTPRNMAEALQYDDAERQLQFHSKTGSPSGKREAMYHGQGVGIDEQQSNVERFFQAVDRSLFPGLDNEGYPVVLGGLDEIVAIYRRISRSNRLLAEAVRRSTHDLSGQKLHGYAWDIVSRYYGGSVEALLEAYRTGRAAGRTAEDMHEVLKAAFEGRVDVLLAARDREVWGVFDSGRVETMVVGRNDAPSADLVNEAVCWTLLKNGRVQLLNGDDMPAESAVCAVLRF